MLVKPVKTDSPEPKALFMHRCAARHLGEISPLPSHFGLLSFPPLQYFSPSWEGEQLWNNLLRLFPSAREDWLTLKTASI